MLFRVVASATQRGTDGSIPQTAMGGRPADDGMELDDGCVAI